MGSGGQSHRERLSPDEETILFPTEMKLLLMLLLLALELTLVCVHAEGETSAMGKNFNPKKVDSWGTVTSDSGGASGNSEVKWVL